MGKTLTALLALLVGAGAAASATMAGQGPKEGIRVHGHWVIDVRGRDGTLVTHREFENGLVPAGQEVLVNLLSRQATAGIWRVLLFGSDGPPCVLNGSPATCNIDQPPGFESNTNFFHTLTLRTTASTTLEGPSLILSGSATAAYSSNVAGVATVIGICPPTGSPSSCGANFSQSQLTAATISPAVHVEPEQIIQVKVIITFS